MSGGVNQASGVTVASPGTQGGEPPKRGGRALAKRQRGVAYGLLAPGALLPVPGVPRAAGPDRLHLAAVRRTALGRVLVHMGVRQLQLGAVRLRRASIGSPWWISATATVFCILARLPHGVLDRVLRGAVEVDVVLPDPGAVLRLVRDQDGAVEVHPGRRRPDLRSAEGPGAAAGELPDPADEDRGDLGDRVQLPAVHVPAPLRRAGAHRQAPGRSRQGPVRVAVPGVPQGGAAAVAAGRVRRGDPDVRAGHGRLRERRRARRTG